MASLPYAGLPSRLASLYRQAKEPFWALAGQVVTSGAGLATSVIIIQAGGLAEFGRFGIAFLVLVISRNFLVAMVLTPMSAIAPRQRGSRALAYRGFLIANTAGFAVATSLLLYLGAQAAGRLIGTPWLHDLGVGLALANVTSCAADFLRRYQFVEARPFAAVAIDAVRFGVQLLLLVGLLILRPQDLNAQAALLALAVAGAVGAALGAALYGPAVWRPRFAHQIWPQHWRYIRSMTPSTTIDSMESTFPFFIGAAFLSDSAFGGLRALQQLAQVLHLPTLAAAQILTSNTVRSAEANRLGHLFKSCALGLLGSTVLALMFVVGVLLFPDALAEFTGKQYNGAQTIFIMFIAFYVMLFVRGSATQILAGLGQLSVVLQNSMLSLICTAALSFALIPTFESEGVAITLILTTIVSSAFQIPAILREVRSARVRGAS